MFDLISISEAIKRSYDSEGLLVDVRSEEVFKKGHLPMAVNLPYEEIIDEKLWELFVTPKEIDEAVKRISYTLSEGINQFVAGRIF